MFIRVHSDPSIDSWSGSRWSHEREYISTDDRRPSNVIWIAAHHWRRVPLLRRDTDCSPREAKLLVAFSSTSGRSPEGNTATPPRPLKWASRAPLTTLCYLDAFRDIAAVLSSGQRARPTARSLLGHHRPVKKSISCLTAHETKNMHEAFRSNLWDNIISRNQRVLETHLRLLNVDILRRIFTFLDRYFL